LKPSKPFLILTALFAVIVGVNCVWFALDDRPPIWDMAVHLATAFDFYEAFKHFSFSWGFIKSLVLLGKFYPTLFPALMGIFLLICHPSIHAGPAANFVPLGVLILATYRIGRKLFTENVGILAAFLAVTYPVMAWLAREALLDFAMTAAVAAAVWAYLETENFSRTRASLVFGIVFALGFLTKHGFIFYALPLALFALFEMWARRDLTSIPRLLRLRNFVLSHAFGTAVAALWYVPHWKDVREYFLLNRQLHSVLHQPEFPSAASLLYTVNSLTQVHMLLIPSAFLLLGIVISLRRFARQALILYCCGLGSLVIMTFTIAHREVRMSVASLPLLAVLTAAGVLEIPFKRWRIGLLVVLVAGAVFEFGLISFGTRILPDRVTVFTSASLEVNLMTQNYGQLVGPPRHEDWKIVPLLRSTAEDAGEQRISRPTLGIVPDLPRLNHFDFILYSKLEAISVEAMRVSQVIEVEEVLKPDYLIIKSGGQGEPGTTRLNAPVNELVHQHPERFTKIVGFELPDRSEVELFRCLRVPAR
jgi:4-amino-4-deoxy-L-arabinose transferase-like glycosyltransferase